MERGAWLFLKRWSRLTPNGGSAGTKIINGFWVSTPFDTTTQLAEPDCAIPFRQAIQVFAYVVRLVSLLSLGVSNRSSASTSAPSHVKIPTIVPGYAHAPDDRKPYQSYCHDSARSQHASLRCKRVFVLRAFLTAVIARQSVGRLRQIYVSS